MSSMEENKSRVKATDLFWNLGDLLTSAREKKGMSRAKLAQFTGISPNTLMRYEAAGSKNGKYPSAVKLTILCRFLEIDPRIAFDCLENDLEIESYIDPTEKKWRFISHFASQEENQTMTYDQMSNFLGGVQRVVMSHMNRMDEYEEYMEGKLDKIAHLLNKNDSEK